MATASHDNTARIWEIASGAHVITPELAELGDRVGLRRTDGTISWPIPPVTLARVGRERPQQLEDEYRVVAERCDALRRLEAPARGE